MSHEVEVQDTHTDNRYLQFNLGSELYAIPLLKVREVIGVPETTIIPNAPKHFVGIMNLRGQVISVLDLRKKMGITPKEEREEEAVVILDLNPIYLGVTVDSVNRVMNIEPENIQDQIDFEGGKKIDYISGVIKNGEDLTVLVDIAKLLNVQDLNTLKQAS